MYLFIYLSIYLFVCIHVYIYTYSIYSYHLCNIYLQSSTCARRNSQVSISFFEETTGCTEGGTVSASWSRKKRSAMHTVEGSEILIYHHLGCFLKSLVNNGDIYHINRGRSFWTRSSTASYLQIGK